MLGIFLFLAHLLFQFLFTHLSGEVPHHANIGEERPSDILLSAEFLKNRYSIFFGMIAVGMAIMICSVSFVLIRALLKKLKRKAAKKEEPEEMEAIPMQKPSKSREPSTSAETATKESSPVKKQSSGETPEETYKIEASSMPVSETSNVPSVTGEAAATTATAATKEMPAVKMQRKEGTPV
ncbi:unnamed protein product [Gongylonema pulchrum]|uniref:Uncharacterized protein n=1 Tax=Gongylonema pulchrum TaxID=637853 RepID=A0A3P6PL16_9BILA|nr:unnamed protein product [Gongylonema pulchrum]